MRVRTLPILAVAIAVTAFSQPAGAQTKDDDLARARVLDREGVRAYSGGRYKDAIRYFTEALKLGGPASEVWNIAKCHLRVDEPEEASDEIQRYLALPGLSPEDRTEATEQLQELQRRRSPLTIASLPAGAAVYLDGKHDAAVGVTPLSVDVPPGSHAVVIEAQGYKPYAAQVEARFGRAVIVDAQLTRGDGAFPPPPGKGKPHAGAPPPTESLRRIAISAEVGAFFPKLGGYDESPQVGVALAGSYVVFDTPDILVSAGLRLLITGDGWSNTINAPSRATNCGAQIPTDESATEVSGFATGAFAYRILPRLRVGADLGLGVATYTASEVGGDVFTGNCQPSFGAKPAMHVGAEVSYSITPLVRAVAAPIMLEVHPSFDGTRTAPMDASATWLRLGMALGVAFDL